MRLAFDPQALEDLRHWVEPDRRKALRIIHLIEQALRSPFAGPGKPEPLNLRLSGCWSRRINREHRLVYQVQGDTLTVLACRYHY
jgi:toxin YoeB